MADGVRVVLLLAGDLDQGDEGVRLGKLATELMARNLLVQVVCLAGAKAVAPAVADIVESPWLSHRWLRSLAMTQLRRSERAATPELLHVLDQDLSEAGLLLAEHWQLPYVLTVHEFLPDGAPFRISRRWCQALVAETPELADWLTRMPGIASNQVRMIRPGLAFESDGVPTSRMPSTVPVLGTGGRLAPGSGHETFLEAARIVLAQGIDAEFLIAGRGPDEHRLRQSAQRLGIAEHVTFTDLPGFDSCFWKVLDLYCQPSRIPTSGLMLATAMAFGVPCIVSDVEGLRALWASGANGVLVPPEAPDALARGMLDLLADPIRARRIANQARAMTREWFDPQRQVKELVGLYREILDDAATGGF